MEPIRTELSILLLEDDPIDVELAKCRLANAGLQCRLVVANSRTSFERAYAEDRFDLILADYSLPDFDGLSALKMVRAQDARIPFIFVSGVLGEDVAVDSLLHGATDYVIKQKMERLVPSVKRALAEQNERLSRERMERELHHVEQRFRGLTDSLPAMVWTCEITGGITFVNSRWLECVGLATTWFETAIVHPADLPTCEQSWAEAQRSGQPLELEARFKIKDQNAYRWQLVRAVPLTDSLGQVSEWVGTCMDLEDQKRRDTELKTSERLALTGRMAAVIAHEINNPLEAVTNLLYLLRSEAPRTAQEESYFALLDHELLRISAITKQTLLWSREEAHETRVKADALIQEALRLFSSRLKNRGVLLRYSSSDLTLYVVMGQIRQVLANLLSNAIDAVPVDGCIEVNCAQVARGDRAFAEIVVSDNGSGIEPNRLAELFRPFQSTKGILGNGLGLYISKEIVERHGGELLVESTLGQGTRMRLLLPLAS